MSKAARLELIRNNIAKQTDDFSHVESSYAYCVWFIEKEFCVGPITEDFLLLKFWNLWDEDNIQKYKDNMSSASSDVPKTMGV